MVKGVCVCADMLEREVEKSVKGREVIKAERFKACEGGNSNAPLFLSFDSSFLWKEYLLEVFLSR